MSKFAMVLNERVISIALSETEPYYPPDVSGNKVTAVLCDDDIYIGMGYKDGVFGEYTPNQPTEPHLSETEQTQLETALNIEYLTCLMELND